MTESYGKYDWIIIETRGTLKTMTCLRCGASIASSTDTKDRQFAIEQAGIRLDFEKDHVECETDQQQRSSI